jgi:hypothetical protein
MANQDFEVHFGKDRYIRLNGWRGILALLLFLSAAVLMACIGTGIPYRISILQAVL